MGGYFNPEIKSLLKLFCFIHMIYEMEWLGMFQIFVYKEMRIELQQQYIQLLKGVTLETRMYFDEITTFFPAFYHVAEHIKHLFTTVAQSYILFEQCLITKTARKNFI
ncbi:hypothetical protein ACJX0J_029575 [Zea mays]